VLVDVDGFFKSGGVNHTPENVQLLVPHRQSLWISQRISEVTNSALCER
jgi:hypothetical protein